MTSRWEGPTGDVRLVNRLATGVAVPRESAERGLRVPGHSYFHWPFLIVLCATAAAVGAAMLRTALQGPAGVFWWLAIVLGFVLGQRWERSQARARELTLARRMHDQLESRLHHIDHRPAGRG